MSFDKTPTLLFPNATNGTNTLILKTSNAPNIPAVAQVQTILCVADVAGSLGGTYFDLADDAGPVRVWLDVDNGSVAPATPSGGRLVEVNIAEDDGASTVAGKVQTAIHADSKFTATVDTATVGATNTPAGAVAGDVDDGDSGFTVTVTVEGADTRPGSSVPEMTDAEAHVATGDLRRIAFALCERMNEYWLETEEPDRSVMMIVNKQTNQIPNSNQVQVGYFFQFTADWAGLEVADEPA
jgi:hypothetical protein